MELRPKRSAAPSLFTVLLICLIVVVALYRYLHRSNPQSSNSQISCGEHCGTERWQIKTVSDPDSRKIDWSPRASSISDLLRLEAPRILDDSRAEAETRVYLVQAVLMGWKEETGAHGDRDYHLVLADPDDLQRTLIAEAPSSDCTSACRSSHVQQFLEARRELVSRLAPPQAH